MVEPPELHGIKLADVACRDDSWWRTWRSPGEVSTMESEDCSVGDKQF